MVPSHVRARLTGASDTQRALLEGALTALGVQVVDAEADVIIADLRRSPERLAEVAGAKSAAPGVPILVLACPGDTHLRAIEAGIDDYLLDPVQPDEIASRCIALVYRRTPRAPLRVHLRDGVVELDSRRVERAGSGARLTATETRLVAFLARHAGRHFTRDELQVHVWGYRPGVKSRTVLSTVQRVRAKLEVDPARPVHLVTDDAGCYALLATRGESGAPGPAVTVPPPFFVGRGHELDALCGLLEGARGAMITIVGPGGMGKTFLARAVAARLEARFRDGAVFVELAAVEDVEQVLPSILAAMGAEQGRDPVQSLVDALTEREALLVLDNLEHLPGLPALLAKVLEAAPSSTVLGTSRMPMKLLRESVYRLEPLAQGQAVALFERTASRARAGWRPTDEGAALIEGVVARVGCIPLAVVLAASWARVLSVADIHDALSTDLALLDDGPVDLPVRHRSVRAVFEGSWALLDPIQRAQLSALSYFRSPFTKETAKAVAGSSLRDLLHLVDGSLLRRDRDRYDLHPLLVQLARERLADSGRHDEVATAHDAWFRTRILDWDEDLRRMRRDEGEIRRERDAVYADVWHVFQRSVERHDYGMIGSATRVMIAGLEATPGLSRVAAPVLAAIPATSRGDAPERIAVRAQALALDGMGRGAAGNPTGGRAVEQAVAALGGSDHPAMVKVRPAVLLAQVVQLFYAGTGTSEHARQAVHAAERAGDLVPWLSAQARLAYFLGREGDAVGMEAVRRDLEAQPEFRGRVVGHSRVYLAAGSYVVGDVEAARAYVFSALPSLHRHGDHVLATFGYSLLVASEVELGMPSAMAHARDAFEDATTMHLLPWVSLGTLAALAHATGLQPGQGPFDLRRAAEVATLAATMPGSVDVMRRIARRALEVLEPQLTAAELASVRAGAPDIDLAALIDEVRGALEPG